MLNDGKGRKKRSGTTKADLSAAVFAFAARGPCFRPPRKAKVRAFPRIESEQSVERWGRMMQDCPPWNPGQRFFVVILVSILALMTARTCLELIGGLTGRTDGRGTVWPEPALILHFWAAPSDQETTGVSEI